jgi:Transposase DDE domain group 1
MTQCTQTGFEFQAHFGRRVTAGFDGGAMTSDAGAILLRETDRRLNLLPRLAACFHDARDPRRISHPVAQLVAQRVHALALGYEDLNDHEQLRDDPLLAVLCGRREAGSERLAGKSTLNRLELSTGETSRYKKIHYDACAIDELLVNVFTEAHDTAPASIVLDLDATDLPLHGHQEGRFFHGYYDSYCYLPLYIFCGDQVLCARLRPSGIDAAAGSREEAERIVNQIRRVWPEAQIILRADSGFCREELMRWCEDNQVDYVFGFARNERLAKLIEPQMEQARKLHAQTGKPARVFTEFSYQTTTGSWSRPRRVVAKAEQLEGKQNPRYVVTSFTAEQWPAQKLYEELYCARGEMENRIKEQMMLFADRVSAETVRANQLRMYLSAMAYVLMEGLRRHGLKDGELAQAQITTIRLRLLKIGALIRITARRVWLSMSATFPWQPVFVRAWANLRC